MTALRFLRKSNKRRRSYLAIVAVPDEAAAFQAYRLLQYHGISPEHLAIVGEGYSSPERVGLLTPMHIALRSARTMAIVAAYLGSAIGFCLFLIWYFWLKTPLSLHLLLAIPAAGIIGGSGGGAVGALFGFFTEGSTAGIYRHHLRQGRYLLMIEGPEKLVRSVQEVLNMYSVHPIH